MRRCSIGLKKSGVVTIVGNIYIRSEFINGPTTGEPGLLKVARKATKAELGERVSHVTN